jgi:pimeloyl-ACP methyl ester carboxylesterase
MKNITRAPITHAFVITSALIMTACGGSNHSTSDSEKSAPDITNTKISTVTQQAIDSAMIDKGIISLTGQAACDVDFYKINYPSTGIHGEAITLSAALSIPSGPGCTGPYPLIAKAHGTRTLKNHTETNITHAIVDHAFFASHSYVVVSPDFLGLGSSDYSYHPYLHRDSEAQSMIDAIRAARTVIKDLDDETELSGKVMLIGYSQGGHAALATQRAIEQDYSEEFNLVASAPMAGPYKLEESFISGINPNINNVAGGVLFSYALQSYQNIYGNMYNDLNDVFLPQYTDPVSSNFPGDVGVFELILSDLFPTDTSLYLQTPYLNNFRDNADHPLRIALRENEVLDNFVPKTPTMLCASSADGTVPFSNTDKAAQYFQSVGVTVPVIDVASLVSVPAGDDEGLTHHIQGYPLCYAMIKMRLLDPAK